MTQNVAQWLAEIQALQQQVAELKQERSQAYTSVDNWRNAYDAEAQQRRRDTQMYRARIEQLEQTVAELQSPAYRDEDISADNLAADFATEPKSTQGNQSIAQLQAQLGAARRECDRLKAALQTEQAEHLNTRENLTAALGDAVDLLSKERS